MKRLEGEVFLELEKYGDRELTFEMQHFSVDPHQFLGIEVNPRAAAITELVLWIGYLQWHFRTRGQTMPAEPIIKKFKNIECRDAVLAWDGDPEPKRDEQGNVITVWDRRSYKKDLITGREIPDESKRAPLLTYRNPRAANWPQAEYIVGNPPFLGKLKIRESLGDGYAEAVRSAYSAVGDGTDFVMFWWYKGAELTRAAKVRRCGFITTNKISQPFNRRVVKTQVDNEQPLSFVFAIPDHPWVDTADGAAVRIAMTVSESGTNLGHLWEVESETLNEDGSATVSMRHKEGRILSDLTIGSDLTKTRPLLANDMMAATGLILGNRGFVLTSQEANELRKRNQECSNLIFPLLNGADINGISRGLFVIDTAGWNEHELRQRVPEIYQRLKDTVFTERQSSRDPRLRKNWWLFRRSNEQVRNSIIGLKRYIATVETSKHRIFTFLQSTEKPEHKLVVIGSDDAYVLGILNNRVHAAHALAAGGWLGVGNDPVYSKTRCFDPFPFPACTDAQHHRIRKIAEELDAHRKHVQEQHPGLTLTGMYNVLEKLRANQPLTAKEKDIHDKGLVSVLKQLHDDLDAAVFDAYGWPQSLTDAEILERLVALNAERAREEAAGQIRWLRPDYQIPLFAKNPNRNPNPNLASQTSQTTGELNLAAPEPKPKPRKTKKSDTLQTAKLPWPSSLPERTKAVLALIQNRGSKPFTAEEIARSFTRAQTSQVAEILETLCAVGKARRGKTSDSFIA